MMESQNKIELDKRLKKDRLDFLERSNREFYNLPIRFRGKRLENFKGFKSEIEIAIEALRNDESVYITGKCGTGKTHLACALMYVWFYEHIRIEKMRQFDGYKESYNYWVNIPNIKPQLISSVELFLELKESFNSDYDSENSILSRYSKLPLLVIDDVGVEKVSDWSRQIFYTLIDRRYRDMKQTIITSNLSLEELSKAIDDRIASRIVEMGKVINLGDKDMRLKK